MIYNHNHNECGRDNTTGTDDETDIGAAQRSTQQRGGKPQAKAPGKGDPEWGWGCDKENFRQIHECKDEANNKIIITKMMEVMMKTMKSNTMEVGV